MTFLGIREGYIFSGWTTEDGIAYDFSLKVTTDLTLVANWKIYVAVEETSVTILDDVSTIETTANTQAIAGYDPAFVLSGNDNGTYTFTLPKTNFNLYSEASAILVFGQGMGSYSFVAYDKTLVSADSKTWFFLKVIRQTDGSYALSIYNADLTSGETVAIPSNVVNGEEGLTFTVIGTTPSWDWMAIRESGSSSACKIVGTQIFEGVGATECNLTADSSKAAYDSYVARIADMTAYEKAHYVEPEIVATLRAKFYPEEA